MGWLVIITTRKKSPVTFGGVGFVSHGASLDGFWGRENPLPPSGFEHRILQPISSRYTDYASWALYKSLSSRRILVLVWDACDLAQALRIIHYLGNFRAVNFLTTPPPPRAVYSCNKCSVSHCIPVISFLCSSFARIFILTPHVYSYSLQSDT
jgi:hypothetical protein